MRAPAVAGAFYPEDAHELRALVAACYDHKLGPGGPPSIITAGPRALKALVVPHAGLDYSGPIAAHAYAALARDGLPEACIIVGPNHTGIRGLADLSNDAWETPLGVVTQHGALRTALEGGIVLPDDEAHAEEHAVEVQLPFLQDLYVRAGRELRFVPVVMGWQDDTTAEELGDALARAVRKTGADTLLIASSDLMHAGPDYRIPVPRGKRVDDFVRAKDEAALRAMEGLDPIRLLNEVRAREITMCGAGPVAAVLHAARRLGARQGHVLAHATSHDVRPHTSAVGYAAVQVL